MIAIAPNDDTVFVLVVCLALEARVHEGRAANGAHFALDVPAPHRDQIPSLESKHVILAFRAAGIRAGQVGAILTRQLIDQVSGHFHRVHLVVAIFHLALAVTSQLVRVVVVVIVIVVQVLFEFAFVLEQIVVLNVGRCFVQY